MNVGTFSSCLWTGIANRVYSGESIIDLGQKHAMDGSIVSAMPPTVNEFWARLPVFVNQMALIDREGMFYSKNSFVEKFQVNNVPLSPHVDENTNPVVFKMLEKHVDALDKMIPERLMTANIGSSIGLLAVMRSIITEIKNQRVQKYRVVLSDVAIFNPILKVIVQNFFTIYDLILTIYINCFLDDVL